MALDCYSGTPQRLEAAPVASGREVRSDGSYRSSSSPEWPDGTSVTDIPVCAAC
ncbi:hypothetical protein ACLBOM_08180 [Escherichia coli]